MIFCLFLISVLTLEFILRRDKKAPPIPDIKETRDIRLEHDISGDLRSLSSALEEHGRGVHPTPEKALEKLPELPPSVEYTVSSDVRAK